ncbi:MAG: hypothetical protein PCFJNLEI_03872 [Verrucomicrobiae bacterium]|nr:hypothetical protein [Verrucomicrobiae bacterium]
MIKNCLCILGLSLTLGCATAIVRPYVGEQQIWPTSNGSIVNVRYDLPVFTSLPPSAYEVIAELRINSPLFAQPVEGHMSTLAKKGVELGADALVFVDGQMFFSTQYGVRGGDATPGGAAPAKKASVTQVNRFNPDSIRPNVNVVAIRWIDEPPVGLPPRYAKYSEKMLLQDAPTITEEPATPATPTPEPTPAVPAAPPQPPAAPTPAPETPKAETAPPPAAPATPEPPKAEAEAPVVTAPNLYMPATPAKPAEEAPAPAKEEPAINLYVPATPKTTP